MFDLDLSIEQWKKTMRRSQAIQDGDLAELEGYLRDKIEDFLGQGMDEEEAFKKAESEFVRAGNLDGDYYRARTHRLSGRPPWQAPRFVPALVWNYLKVSFRKIKRQKGYSFINIAGLTAGMAAFLLIFLYCGFELSYDNFHQNGSRIYRIQNDRVYSTKHDGSAGCTPGVGPAMKEEFPEIVDFARLLNISSNPSIVSRDSSAETGSPADGESRAETRAISFYEKKIFFAEASFLRMFSFPLVEGSPETALREPATAVMSESTARRYFGRDNPLGKTVAVTNDWGKQVYKITGICQDVPENSHLKFDILLSYLSLSRLWPATEEDPWSSNSFLTYVLLSPVADPRSLEAKFPQLNQKYPLEAADYKREFHLQPLRSIHLHSRLRMEPDVNGDSKTVVFLEIIGLFILLIAWVNFVNLATARSLQRGKEVGVRKTLGAERWQLISQFLSESTLFNVLAFLLALAVVSISLPAFCQLVGKPLSLSYMGIGWIWLGLSILAGAILSGLYPAFVLSSFRPVTALRGLSGGTLKGTALRKGLVLVQFAISVLLIASTFIVGRQLAFMRNQDLGVDMDRTMALKLPQFQSGGWELSLLIREQLSKLAPVMGATISASVPGLEYSNAASGIRRQTASPEEAQHLFFIDVDENYFQLFGIPLLCGRTFSRDHQSDEDAVVLNEETVKMLGFESAEKALQEKVVLGGFGHRVVNVIGVVRNYHHKSLRDRIEPVIYSLPGRAYFLSLRIQGAQIGLAVSLIKKKWQELVPGQPLEYFFLDDAFNNQYKSDKRFGQVFGLSAFLAILISCLGLFGLASFSAEQRTREIGIRKVFGASVPGIVVMLSREFANWVLLANLIAWPVTYFVMSKWLQEFAYRTTVELWTLGISSILSLIIAFLTVSFHALRAALANPVDSLRYE